MSASPLQFPGAPRGPSPSGLLAVVALAGCVLLGLWTARLHNRAALAEQNASIAEAEIQSLRQELDIERLLAERLAGEVVDLGQVRLATLSPADSASIPVFAVVWSPASGDGVLVSIGDPALPADARFRLTATRRPAADRLENDPVFDAAPPLPFSRGLFSYRPPHAAQVNAFTLEITSPQNPAQSLRLGGVLHP